MNALAIVQLVVMLLEGVAVAAKQQGMADIAKAAGNALTELTAVHGSEVTAGQLASLKVEPTWPVVP